MKSQESEQPDLKKDEEEDLAGDPGCGSQGQPPQAHHQDR